jgi:hypothetical protein
LRHPINLDQPCPHDPHRAGASLRRSAQTSTFGDDGRRQRTVMIERQGGGYAVAQRTARRVIWALELTIRRTASGHGCGPPARPVVFVRGVALPARCQ